MYLAKIASGIVAEVIDNGLTVNTAYSSDGNNIIMKFDGYPL